VPPNIESPRCRKVSARLLSMNESTQDLAPYVWSIHALAKSSMIEIMVHDTLDRSTFDIPGTKHRTSILVRSDRSKTLAVTFTGADFE